MNDLQTILLLFIVLVCVLPFVLAVISGYLLLRFGQRRIEKFVEPDSQKIQQEFQQLRAKNPKANTDQLVKKIIHKQAIKSGMIGAVTSFGGFVTLPIALPIDIVMSMRIQAAMVEVIAQIYGQNPSDQLASQMRSYLVTTGSHEITQRAGQMIMKMLVKYMGKSFAKLIPILGALIGFGLNYTSTQTAGRVANRWYIHQTQKQLTG